MTARETGTQSARREATRAMSMEGFFADEPILDAPPSPDDDYDVRAAWARDAVAHVMERSDEQRSARLALPDDIRPSHFWEVEFQSALVDPIAYARSMATTERVLN